MSELSAQHYLYVWSGRLSMAERGVTKSPPALIDVMRQLTIAFSKIDPKAEIRVETNGGHTRFVVEETGELIGEYDLSDFTNPKGALDHTSFKKENVVIGRSPWVRVIEYKRVVFDDEGFQSPEDETSRVAWHRVRRVAVGYEIHSLVIVDWDFVAFQCEEEDVTYWVQAEPGDAFMSEVRRRFGACDIPAMEDWADSEFCIRAYTIWPLADIGKPMFKTVKRHWWSLRARLSYAEVSQPNASRG